MSAGAICLRVLFVVFAASQLSGAQADDEKPPADQPSYDKFGQLHLTRPVRNDGTTVLLVSDSGGWAQRQDDLSAALAKRGALVVGVDLSSYLKHLNTGKGKCSYPAADFEQLAHWIERHEGYADYSAPLLVGDSAGATFAYAVAAQAPSGTFAGLITLSGDPALRLHKPMCPGDAGAMTSNAASGVRIVAVKQFPMTWSARPPASTLSVVTANVANSTSELPVQRAFSDPSGDLSSAFDDWTAQSKTTHEREQIEQPGDIGDLPLIEIVPVSGSSSQDPQRIALILTGDGGWAGLDKGVADALSGHGIRVVGFSTLKYFWNRRTPAESSQAVARVLQHYAAQYPLARFIVIGYSFGASLTPVVLNRLPPEMLARVDGGVMISPDPDAVFEIKIGDWLSSAKHDDSLPIAPEIAISKVPLVCVHGNDEHESFCRDGSTLHVVGLPGSHHYNGNYAALGNAIVKNLPVADGIARP